MSILSKLRNSVADFVKPEETDAEPTAAQVPHESFIGSHFVVVAAAIIGLLWAPKLGFATELIQYCFWLVIAYIISDTITRTVQIVVNGRLAQDFQAFAYKDGKLDENETKVISGRHQSV